MASEVDIQWADFAVTATAKNSKDATTRAVASRLSFCGATPWIMMERKSVHHSSCLVIVETM
jgi:hypothetical protein